MDEFNKPIPKTELLEMWEEHNFIDSPFVEIPKVIKMDGEEKIIVDLQYPKLGMKYATEKCLIRKEVLEKLLVACTYLPKGLSFKIWDIYRPWNLQNELYYVYKPDIIKQFDLKDLPKEEQEKVISNYVSLPSENRDLPPLHTTGGSIDLTLTDLNEGKDLDFGINFDDFSDLTNTSAYEDGLNDNVRDNRRILYNTMIKAGFTNLPSEVWHYDFGNRSWAYYTKKPAIYKGVFSISEMTKIISFDEFLSLMQNEETFSHNWEYPQKSNKR